MKPTEASTPIDVFYLVGVSYCGSTLLSFMLNTHPQIFGIGEMGPYAPYENEEYRCSCGEKLTECPFVSKVKYLMENNYGIPFDTAQWNLRHEVTLNRFTKFLTRDPIGSSFLTLISPIAKTLFLNYKEMIQTYSARNEAFMRAALDATGKQVFFDATKSFRRIQLFNKNPNINLKVLHLVRDPRGYVFSALNRHRKPVHISARQWVLENSFIDSNLRGHNPHKWIHLKYETLCLEPEKTLNNLADFVGVDSFAALPERFGDNVHHIIGNNMRLRPDALKSIKFDEKWRGNLSADDLKIVGRIAGEQAKKYGYDI